LFLWHRIHVSTLKSKKAIPPAGDGLCFDALFVWLHHPLHVGTRMPTLIRSRLISSDTRGDAAADDIGFL
jgi:hypothetical protein